MNSDIKQMVKALEAEGWSIGTDGRVARTIERGGVTVEKVNATVWAIPLRRSPEPLVR